MPPARARANRVRTRRAPLRAALAVLALGGLHGVAEHDGGGEHDRADEEAGDHDGHEGAVEAHGEADHEADDREPEQAVADPLADLDASGRCGPGGRGRGRPAASGLTPTSLPQRAGRRGPGGAGRGRSARGPAAALWSSRAGVGRREERVERGGVVGVEPAEAERRGARRPPGRARRRRPAVDGGLDRRVAEPLPAWTGRRRRRRRRRRRPSCPGGGAVDARGTPARGEDRGRARRRSPSSAGPGEPVGGVERLGEARPRRARPCGGWRARGGARAARRSATSSAARVPARSPAGASTSKRVVDRGGLDAPLGQLAAR